MFLKKERHFVLKPNKRVLKLNGLETVCFLTPTINRPCKSLIISHCMHTIIPKTRGGMRLEEFHESKQTSLSHYQEHTPLSYCATFHRQWHMKHLFPGSVLQRKSTHLLPPPALSPKLISCVDEFMFAFQRTGRFYSIIITPAPVCFSLNQI